MKTLWNQTMQNILKFLKMFRKCLALILISALLEKQAGAELCQAQLR